MKLLGKNDVIRTELTLLDKAGSHAVHVWKAGFFDGHAVTLLQKLCSLRDDVLCPHSCWSVAENLLCLPTKVFAADGFLDVLSAPRVFQRENSAFRCREIVRD